MKKVDYDPFRIETPSSETDVILNIWKQVLQINHIKPEDDFFVLGGHSLLAVELVTELKKKLSRKVTIRDIFEYSTVSKLASHLSTQNVVEAQTFFPIPKTKNEEGPLSLNQTQVWYVDELFPHTRIHNLPTSIRIKWEIDPQLLEKVFHILIARHESLRTGIQMVDDFPVQKVIAVEDALKNFSFTTQKVNEKNLMDCLRKDADVTFNKKTPPLFKAKLYQLAKDDFSLFIMAHHAVWDGWCFDIFFEELDIIYTSLLNNEPPKFKRNPEVRYIDYTNWFQKNLATGKYDSQKMYWQQKLKAPLPLLDLPLDFKRPLVPGHQGGVRRFQLNQDQIDRLIKYSQEKQSSIFNVMLTAFKLTLARVSGQNDIIVGSPVRGRHSQELLQTIGYFVNTVAIRSEIDVNDSFEANLKRVTNNCLEAFSNEELPFEIVLKNIEYKKDPSRSAIFQSFFTFQEMTNRQFKINEKPIQQVSVSNASSKTDLDIWVRVTNTEIRGAFEYRMDLFKPETVEKFAESFLKQIDELTGPKKSPHFWRRFF